MKKFLILLLFISSILPMQKKTKKTHKDVELYEREVKVLELSFLKEMQQQYKEVMPYDDGKELDAYLIKEAIDLFQEHKKRLPEEEKTFLSSYSFKLKMSDVWKKRKIEQPRMINLETQQEKNGSQVKQ